MSKIIIEIEESSVVRVLQNFGKYFDTKYPCTDETNDGSDMPEEDQIDFEAYNNLIAAYHKFFQKNTITQ